MLHLLGLADLAIHLLVEARELVQAVAPAHQVAYEQRRELVRQQDLLADRPREQKSYEKVLLRRGRADVLERGRVRHEFVAPGRHEQAIVGVEQLVSRDYPVQHLNQELLEEPPVVVTVLHLAKLVHEADLYLRSRVPVLQHHLDQSPRVFDQKLPADPRVYRRRCRARQRFVEKDKS